MSRSVVVYSSVEKGKLGERVGYNVGKGRKEVMIAHGSRIDNYDFKEIKTCSRYVLIVDFTRFCNNNKNSPKFPPPSPPQLVNVLPTFIFV